MTEVRLPALVGTDPLGVLAGLGTLRVLTKFGSTAPRLRWDPADLVAVLCYPDDADISTLQEVAAELQAIVRSIEDAALLPGVPSGFPSASAMPSKLKVAQAELAGEAAEMLERLPRDERSEIEQWLASLATDLAADPKGNAGTSQLIALAGQQTVETVLPKPLELVRADPDYLRQALEGWRRLPGVTGEYLDHRAAWSSVDDPSGKNGRMRGVPGATWLALMAFPLFRTSAGSNGKSHTSGWHSTREGRRRVWELRLPVWTQALTPTGVIALMEHQALAREKSRELAALGVVHVCRARRHKADGMKSSGFLAPVK